MSLTECICNQLPTCNRCTIKRSECQASFFWCTVGECATHLRGAWHILLPIQFQKRTEQRLRPAHNFLGGRKFFRVMADAPAARDKQHARRSNAGNVGGVVPRAAGHVEGIERLGGAGALDGLDDVWCKADRGLVRKDTRFNRNRTTGGNIRDMALDGGDTFALGIGVIVGLAGAAFLRGNDSER